MTITMKMYDPVPVCVSPVNEMTSKWGVYSIPRLWRDPSGKLIMRINGEQDCADQDNLLRVPTLWYTSDDNGITWTQSNEAYPTDSIQGISSPYLKLRNGDLISIREKSGNKPINGLTPEKEFVHPCMEAVLHTYKWSDIPKDCRQLELLRFKPGAATPVVSELCLDFDEREVLVNAMAQADSNVNLQSPDAPVDFFPIDEYLKPTFFRNPYISCLTELPDNTIAGICAGQAPGVCDRYCTEVYCVTSEDFGITWTKRGTVAAVSNSIESLALPYGYGGDGHEVSLALTPDGELLCVMRMDLSINPDTAKPFWGTMLARSADFGYTWEKPVPVSDESVTPHVIALKNGVTAVTYGRPGIHMIYSEDNMRSFSTPVSIIGETLWQNRRKGIRDLDCKYGSASVSYANSFVEIISDDSFLIGYNDLMYKDDEGVDHKATLVRRVTLTKND